MKKIIPPVVIIAVALSLTAAMVLMKDPPARKEPPDDTMLVETVPLNGREISFEISSQGNVTAHTNTTLISEISGVVLEVSDAFVAGGFFKRGDELLRLDPSDYEVALQQAQANLIGMQAKLTREEALAEQAKKEWDLSGRSRKQAPILALRTPYLEEARANVLTAEADLKKARRKLELTRVRAPYDGMVREKLVDIGQYINIGATLAHTFAVDFAEVRLPLTDQDIAFLDLPRAGSETLQTDNGPTVELTAVIGGTPYHWSANIVRTEGVIDERTRVHYAIARISDPYGISNGGERPPLAIGSFVTARIRSKPYRDIIPIPLQAVRGMDQVQIMDNEGRLRLRQADILRWDKQFIYIRDPDFENRHAVTTSIEDPVDGMKIRSTPPAS